MPLRHAVVATLCLHLASSARAAGEPSVAELEIARERAILAARSGTLDPSVAQAQDRLVLALDRPQRFGTQTDRLDRVETGGPAAVTDDLRAELMVPPLSALREQGDAAFASFAPALSARLAERSSPEWRARSDARASSRGLAGLATRTASGKLTDAQRRRVLDAHARGDLGSAADHASAAIVLLGSKDPSDLALANDFALVATLRNEPGGAWLFARTWDAFLASIGRPPRYGTTGGAAAADVTPDLLRVAGLAGGAPRPESSRQAGSGAGKRGTQVGAP
jgi:hypothetical protein